MATQSTRSISKSKIYLDVSSNFASILPGSVADPLYIITRKVSVIVFLPGEVGRRRQLEAGIKEPFYLNDLCSNTHKTLITLQLVCNSFKNECQHISDTVVCDSTSK